jgi:hypothetical protein
MWIQTTSYFSGLGVLAFTDMYLRNTYIMVGIKYKYIPGTRKSPVQKNKKRKKKQEQKLFKTVGTNHSNHSAPTQAGCSVVGYSFFVSPST